MERLTYRDEDGDAAFVEISRDGETIPVSQQIHYWAKRLAAYEDTGLEPEQVKAFVSTADNIVKLDINKLYPDAEITMYGKPLNHWQELSKAEQEGRLVVLPCKVGDRVWGVEFDTSECPHCFGFGGCFGCSGAKPKGVYYFKFRLRDAEKIGKTVFLTRAEAEAAMKGVSEDG
jgi:hypothetical protein